MVLHQVDIHCTIIEKRYLYFFLYKSYRKHKNVRQAKIFIVVNIVD